MMIHGITDCTFVDDNSPGCFFKFLIPTFTDTMHFGSAVC